MAGTTALPPTKPGRGPANVSGPHGVSARRCTPTGLRAPWLLRPSSARSRATPHGLAVQLLQHGDDGVLGNRRRETNEDAVDHPGAAVTDLARDLIDGCDDRERLENLVVDQRSHRIPLALEAQPVQFGVQVPPAVQLEHLPVCGG